MAYDLQSVVYTPKLLNSSTPLECEACES